MTEKIEYRVRTVTRYIVTRYEQSENTGAVQTKGEYDSPSVAYDVAYALARAEHERLGYPPGDMRIIYPEHPQGSRTKLIAGGPLEAGQLVICDEEGKAVGLPIFNATSTIFISTEELAKAEQPARYFPCSLRSFMAEDAE